jgi:hypothetical protein
MTNLSPAAQMTDQHPITPPPELVTDWCGQLARENDYGPTCVYDIATQAARWGADQELEACCEWVAVESIAAATELRAARRPKPPSLKEQALFHFESFAATFETSGGDSDLIRRALEALPE